MKEYQAMLQHLSKVATHHRYEADACEQNILFIECMLSAMQELSQRIQTLEKESSTKKI